MIHSSVSYMIELWGSASFSCLKPLQVLLNRAMRLIYDVPFLEPRTSIYNVATALPLLGIYESSVSTFVYKSLKGLIHSETHFHATSHNYGSRRAHLLTKPKCNLEMCKRSVSYAGPSIYNALPDDCKAATGIRRFKRLTNDHLKTRTATYFSHM